MSDYGLFSITELKYKSATVEASALVDRTMIRILLVEDQEIVRRGLKTLLDLQPDLQVVAEAGNGQDAILQLKTLQTVDRFPDVVMMDIRMPILDGVKATQQICQQYPNLKILMLTTFDDAKYISEALRFGAKGYL